MLQALLIALATALLAFVGKQLVWPLLRSGWARLRLRHRTRNASRDVLAELDENISRLGKVQIGFIEQDNGGNERKVYRFGSAYSGLPSPEFPVLARSALFTSLRLLRRALDERARAIDDALGALERYDAIDRTKFREAWRGAMNPVMERMVLDDPGHRTNRANSSFVIDTDKEVQAMLVALQRLRAEVQGIAT